MACLLRAGAVADLSPHVARVHCAGRRLVALQLAFGTTMRKGRRWSGWASSGYRRAVCASRPTICALLRLSGAAIGSPAWRAGATGPRPSARSSRTWLPQQARATREPERGPEPRREASSSGDHAARRGRGGHRVVPAGLEPSCTSPSSITVRGTSIPPPRPSSARRGKHGSRLEVKVTAEPEVVRQAERVVLPGVGAFADCRQGLRRHSRHDRGAGTGGAAARQAVSRHLRRAAADGRARTRTWADARALAGSAAR